MDELMIISQEPDKLKEKVLRFAHKFVGKELLRLADLNKGDWIIEPLARLEPTRELNSDGYAGLISLMTLLGDKSVEQIPLFLDNIDQ